MQFRLCPFPPYLFDSSIVESWKHICIFPSCTIQLSVINTDSQSPNLTTYQDGRVWAIPFLKHSSIKHFFYVLHGFFVLPVGILRNSCLNCLSFSFSSSILCFTIFVLPRSSGQVETKMFPFNKNLLNFKVID